MASGGARRGLPTPCRRRAGPGAARPARPQPLRGSGARGVPAAVEPARAVRSGAGHAPVVPARAGPWPRGRRPALGERPTQPGGTGSPSDRRSRLRPRARGRRPDGRRAGAHGALVAARGRARGHRAGVLRRAHVPAGGVDPRPARGDHQEPDPLGHAASARRPRRRRGGADMTWNPDQNELDELLGAFALDAVEPEEAERLEDYLRENPRARAEVVEYREAAAFIASSGAEAPPGIWDRIAEQIEQPPEGQPVPLLDFRRRGG